MALSFQQGNWGGGAITTGARPCLIYCVMPYLFAVPYLCARVRVRVRVRVSARRRERPSHGPALPLRYTANIVAGHVFDGFRAAPAGGF